jgi:hypothetical protein
MSNDNRPNLDDDDVLMRLLGETLDEAEPLSDDFVSTVSDAAFGLRRIDAELADLVFDSDLAATGARGDDSARNVVFSKSGVEVDIEIAADGRMVHGLVQPADTVCEIETPSGRQPVDVDADGRFDLAVDARQFRLVMTSSDGTRVATPWIFR